MILALAASVCAGFALLWLWTAQKGWKGMMLERRINQEQTISQETLAHVWDNVKELNSTFFTGSHVHFPGLAGQMLIMDESVPAEVRSTVFISSEASIRNALTREPADSFAWARLAWLSYLQSGPSPGSLAALKMSIYTAPAKKSLLFWRIRLCVQNRAYWDEELTSLLKRQIALAWSVSPGRLAAVAAESGIEDLSKEVLQGKPEDLKRFEHLLSRHN